ncbi:MAG: iron-sulfur cluster assembly accessory protein [Deltaproteobacteria bacterium CG11_big_fil_rev_8_21_14_0_20_45_16]|nr:MAG: iron-sulfur cluster assembly accessory protein [Deltaproteobacteria bacterium CG11_big_fil_rev_8_21_14_0_20_45_16]
MTSPAVQTSKTLSLSDRARDKILSLMKRESKPEGCALRVSVVGGGCSGFSYKMSFEDTSKAGDQEISENGIRIFLDPKSALFLEGIEIDFEDGLNGSGFIYKNPKASKSCGCGTSFSV